MILQRTFGLTAAAVALGLSFGQPAVAQEAAAAPNASFAKLDTNHDKFLSRAEAAKDAKVAKIFTHADLNKDGKLDEDEYLKGLATAQRTQAGEYAGDAAVTTKVKAALLGADGLPSTGILVQTENGKVTLTGHVDKKEHVAQASRVAKGVAGVRSVQNRLTVGKPA